MTRNKAAPAGIDDFAKWEIECAGGSVFGTKVGGSDNQVRPCRTRVLVKVGNHGFRGIAEKGRF